MQISTHTETQAHLHGLCDCDSPAADMPAAPAWSTKDEDVDEDSGDRPVRRPEQRPATRKLSDAEIARRRRARRRF